MSYSVIKYTTTKGILISIPKTHISIVRILICLGLLGKTYQLNNAMQKQNDSAIKFIISISSRYIIFFVYYPAHCQITITLCSLHPAMIYYAVSWFSSHNTANHCSCAIAAYIVLVCCCLLLLSTYIAPCLYAVSKYLSTYSIPLNTPRTSSPHITPNTKNGALMINLIILILSPLIY